MRIESDRPVRLDPRLTAAALAALPPTLVALEEAQRVLARNKDRIPLS